MKTLLILAASLLVAGTAVAGPYPDITHQQLVSAVESKSVVLLDVNGTHSYREGHIPGAIDFIANKKKLAQLLPTDKNALIVAYCANPQCAAYLNGAAAAQKLGYKNIRHLAEGIEGWKASGAPVEKTT